MGGTLFSVCPVVHPAPPSLYSKHPGNVERISSCASARLFFPRKERVFRIANVKAFMNRRCRLSHYCVISVGNRELHNRHLF